MVTRSKSGKKPAARSRKKGAAAAASSAPTGLFNREFSWLDFNMRVLAQAEDDSLPLLERVKFLSIFSSNLDEFFMVRVAGLKEQLRVGTVAPSRSVELTPQEQLTGITQRVRCAVQAQSQAWTSLLEPALMQQGIELLQPSNVTSTERRYLNDYFLRQVFPVLTPMSVDTAHPFPHLQNRAIFLCVRVDDKNDDPRPLYAFVEVPQILPRFIPMRKSKSNTRFMLLDDLISMHLGHLFPGSDVMDSFTVRVTRDSDLEIDEEDAEDLLKVIQEELRERKWGNVVRVEINASAPEDVLGFLEEMLEVERHDFFTINGPLNFVDFMFLYRLPGFENLRYEPFTPVVPSEWKSVDDPLALIAEHDRLVHHPYDSFSTVVDFLEHVANDPNVLAIKMTLYRTGADSPLMKSLIKAANNGKQVAVLVELRARFDEANNIEWAQRLEHEGVHVVYGIVGLKTHCKAILVVRREDKTLRRYCHLGTGNYNHVTANLYTDLGLFTAHPGICEDVANLFNMLTGFGQKVQWNAIVPSPNLMNKHLLRMIRSEIHHARRGRPAEIICKMNSLVHPPLIEALYDASRAGVKIQLIVRGICSLRPGVPGQSENIRVVSLVGRFLEHSRIFLFHQNGKPAVYLSSADWMQRNFYSRIEVMFPIFDKQVRQRIIDEVLGHALEDTANAWELQSDGKWKRRLKTEGDQFDSQQKFIDIARSHIESL